jgi:23S rRNA (uracil1939-C5)-methyltransferase
MQVNSAETESPLVEVELEQVAHGGEMIGRVDGEVVFVPYGLPGERASARLSRRKKAFAKGELVEVLRSAAGRVEPRCPYFGACGGCSWQHADYAVQLQLKRGVIVDQLRRIGGMADAEELVREPIGMVEPWEYRNHVRFTLGRKWGDVGYTYRESHRLLRIDHCDIAHPAINRVLAIVQRRCAGARSHQIMVRYGANTGDLLVNPSLPMIPELQSGQASLTEQVLDRTFIISPAAFFQVNTRREARPVPEQIAAPWIEQREGDYSIADLLALLVLDRLEVEPDETVLDAYCGVGTFAALVAPRVREVIGIDESKAAVANAARNTSDLDNVRFIAAKTEAALVELEGQIDAVVLDPARVGCAPDVVAALLRRHPRRIVYVSCDPATLARDLRLLRDGGYGIDGIEPIDMFPQTFHIESVTTLTWTGDTIKG